ncbi:MAG: PGPGW domain-containing protein [Candidatus Saccharimonadales bacterium]
MDYIKRNAKRIATDAAGYFLVLAAIATGWLPGPGGIPLALAGLGLLSINNPWARRIRDYILRNGGKVIQFLFPRNKYIEWLYDFIVILLLALTAALAWTHSAIWQISIAVGAFFIALFIALMNRDRLVKLRGQKRKP